MDVSRSTPGAERRKTAAPLLLLGMGAALALPACSRLHYKGSADEEAYGILSEKGREIFGEARPFSVEPERPDPVETAATARDLPGPGGGETIPESLSLKDALRLASRRNRAHQAEKEELYRAALALTLERWRRGPRFFGSADAEAARDNGADSSSLSGSARLRAEDLLSTGAAVSLEVTQAALKALDPRARTALTGGLVAAVSQPLLRGAGAAVVEEPLVQAERNVVYGLRSYERFRRTLAVDVAEAYFRLLQRGAIRDHERSNYENLKAGRERAELMAKAGRLPALEVDQARQAELRAHNEWINAQNAYWSRLDEFRILLGIPSDARTQPDPAELDRLGREAPAAPKGPAEPAIRAALERRLDLRNAREQILDRRRKVKVAENALLPVLTVKASAELEAGDAVYKAGLLLDLPLERLPERNAYRDSLIALEAEKRNWLLARDRAANEARDQRRALATAAESYAIQERSLELAQRRVDSTALLQQAGRATTRDALEARSALLEAQNARTAALVNFHVARLRFLLATERLEVNEEGAMTAVP